jgi:hypothetical protein
VLRDLRKAGWIVRKVWRAEKRDRGHGRPPVYRPSGELHDLRETGALTEQPSRPVAAPDPMLRSPCDRPYQPKAGSPVRVCAIDPPNQ